jgi:lipopolysaccharide export LptBFGC system permease protein LptF
MLKTCNSCHKELAATTDNFYIKARGEFGLLSKCKNCHAEYEKKYQQENRIKLAESAKKYRQENKIRIAEKKKKYRQENKIRIAEWHKKYRQENKITITEEKKKYYQENRIKIIKDARKNTKNLNLPYLKRLLKRQGFSTEQITPEIIELKLILIKTTRL